LEDDYREIEMIDDAILNEIAIYAAIVFFAGGVSYIVHLLLSGDY